MNLKMPGCVALLILLAAPVAAEITLSPEGEIYAGDVITISGTTSFSPENRVLVEVQPLSFAPTNKTEPGDITGYTETTQIVEEDGENRWSVVVDTSSFAPGDYLVTAEVVGTDAVDTASFTLLPRPAETTEPAAPSASEPAPSPDGAMTTVPEETATTAAGMGLFACIAGIAAAFAVAALYSRR